MPIQLRSILLAVFAASGFLVPGWRVSHADVAVFSPSKDNTLYESETGALSNGAGSWFFSGQTNGFELRRGILAFDLTSIAPGSIILEVSLVLFMDQSFSATPRTIRMHRVLQDWGEGTTDGGFGEGGGGPSTPGSVTWIHTFFNENLWVEQGGDLSETASAATDVGEEGFSYTWASRGLATDVQAWIDDPAANFGWILIGNEAVLGTAKRFRAKEFPDPFTIPALTVSFLPNPVSAQAGVDSNSWGRIKNLYRQ